MGLIKFLFGDDKETIQLKNKVNELNRLNSDLTYKTQEYQNKIQSLQQENYILKKKINELEEDCLIHKKKLDIIY